MADEPESPENGDVGDLDVVVFHVDVDVGAASRELLFELFFGLFLLGQVDIDAVEPAVEGRIGIVGSKLTAWGEVVPQNPGVRHVERAI